MSTIIPEIRDALRKKTDLALTVGGGEKDACSVFVDCLELDALLCVMNVAERRIAELERERDALIKTLVDGANECPYLTFWADDLEAEMPNWCECNDTEEGGFDCHIRNIHSCWLAWVEGAK